jgi:hypothetical protein
MERSVEYNDMVAAAGLTPFLAGGKSLGDYCVSQSDIYAKMKEQSNFVPLCKFLTNNLLISKAFLLFDEFGIWPSSEDRYLYNALYKHYVGCNFLNHSATIAFDHNDADALISFLHLGFEFGWGGYLIVSKNRFLRFTHDSDLFSKCSGLSLDELSTFGAVRRAERRSET